MTDKPLRNPRHEAFARHYVRLGVARHAYVAAGYKAKLDDIAGSNSADVNAHYLIKNPKVESRIAGIKAAMAKRAEVTEDSILEELEQARRGAMNTEQHSAAISASVAKAKLVGLMVDRQETRNTTDLSRMSESELRQLIADNEAQAGTTETESSRLAEATHEAPKQKQ